MYSVYVLQSVGHNRYYIGHTSDIPKRVMRHNNGYVRSTKAYRPWNVVYTEHYNTKSQAYKREMEIKSYKGGIPFQKLVNNNTPS